MRAGLLICLLTALAVFAVAQFLYYMPIDSRTVYVGHAHLGEAVYTHGSALKVVNLQSRLITFRGVNPGMVASPWLPNGASVEYSYTRAAALFNITEIDPRKDVEWYIYLLHSADIWAANPLLIVYDISYRHSPDIWERLPAAITYGLYVAVKSGDGPVLDLTCLKAWKNGLYNYTCPSSPRARLNYVMAYYAVTYSNVYIYKFAFAGATKNITASGPNYITIGMGQNITITLPKHFDAITGRLEVNGTIANNTVVNIFGARYNVTARDLGTRVFCVGFNSLLPVFAGIGAPVKCVSMPTPPRNVTVSVRPHNATASAVNVYVDGELFHTFYVDGPDTVLYTGPYVKPLMTTAAAFIQLNYPGRPLKPLGSALLLIGNDTVMHPPKYVLKAMEPGQVVITPPGSRYPYLYRVNPGLDATWADVVLTWSGVHVRPGSMGNNATVYSWPTVPVRIHGRVVELPYLAMLNASRLCQYGIARASGNYSPTSGGWIRVSGPTSVHCTEYPVKFLLPNGTSVVAPAPINKTFVWSPPAIVYPNGTRLEADPVSVFVDGPKTVHVNYARVYYLVQVVTPLGVNETWAPRGAAASAPAVINLGNGTRWVAEGPTSAVAEGPLVLAPRYKKQYLIRLNAPINSTEAWLDEGSVFRVDLADLWEPGNGTLFKKLLINGSAAREWRVERPTTLKAQYAETYYYVDVETPVNKTAGWMPKGAVLKFPDFVDFGNGTRLVGPNVSAVKVERPVKTKIFYSKRQYYVKIEGVERWEGWVDAGSLIRLNATVVNGVTYTPLEAVVVASPGVYRPRFEATYRTVVRDALGLPNPLGSVELCNATAPAGLDGSAVVTIHTDGLCTPKVRTTPVGPYTIAIIALAAVIAAVAVKKRKEQKL
ncbi:MAG: thermopsin-like protease [Pyrobaculum sp.]